MSPRPAAALRSLPCCATSTSRPFSTSAGCWDPMAARRDRGEPQPRTQGLAQRTPGAVTCPAAVPSTSQADGTKKRGAAVTEQIRYVQEPDLTPAEFIDVLRRSTLAERRPVGDAET